jgi:exodeoxyribonuclease VII small subunit
MSESESASFNKNYQILKQTADWLSQQKEPDIDQLVPKVEAAMKAYRLCKDRLETVQETLSQYFEPDDGSDGEAPQTPSGRAGRKPPPPASDDDGDDIEF